MDKVTSGDGGNILKDQANDNKQRSPETATTKVVAEGSSEGGGGRYEWSSVSPTLRSPSEHPPGPDFNPDFGKMNQEFRNKIRSRQHEEWD